MNKEQILETIHLLAKSQGFYSGMLSFLMEDSKESEDYLTMLVEKNFKNPADLILYFEG